MKAAALMLLGVGLCACGNPPSTVDAGTTVSCHDMPFTMHGVEGMPVAASLAANVFSIPVTVGSTTNTMVVDTGAPITIIDPAFFPSETLPMGQGTGPNVTVGSLVLESPSVVGAGVGASTPDGLLAGLFGGDLLCHFTTSFDYRGARVFFGEGALPTDLGNPATIELPIEGGGVGQVSTGGQVVLVRVPATRLVVTAIIEGSARTYIVDTGASLTLLKSDLFASLVSDGRGTLSGGAASTVMGSVGITLTRAKSISVGGLEVKGSVLGSLDKSILAQLSAEVGHSVDGLLGGTFLREFLVSTDYDARTLVLRQYPNRAHVHDEFIRAGFSMAAISPTPAAGQAHYQVISVFAGSDAAAQGITVGTKILAVDGTVLEGLRPSEADALLLGAAGSTKSIVTELGVTVVHVENLIAP